MVDCGVYVDGQRLPGKYSHAAALAKVHELEQAGTEAFAWIGLHEPDHHQMEAVAETYSMHKLAVEDAVHAHQRPKLERYDDTLILVLKTVNYVEHESVAKARQIVETGELMIFVGADFVITVRHGDHSGLAGIRKRFDTSPDIVKLGPYAILHAIADNVVDSYLDVTDLVEADIDAMEERIFAPRNPTRIEPIYLLKREMVALRRAIGPLTVALQRLATDHNDLISVEVRHYIQDVLDHNIVAAERVSAYDEMLDSMVQAALGRVAMQQNIDMRKISAYAAIAAAPTMVAGIYGMNFDFMPELHSRWGYPMVVGLMLGLCILLYVAFRRRHWL